jgi:predicted secreted protein
MIRLAFTSRPAVLGAVLLVVAAQSATLGAAHAEDTLLRLAETATVLVTPDELAATLRAGATAPNAQEAQTRVNEMMRDALTIARKVEGITVSTGGYTVWRAGQDHTEGWQAGQNLNLTGRDGATVLKLVGDLQQKGLATANLTWRLSPETERKARKDATRQALSALRGRADEAAEVLGLRFDSFREVRLDSATPQMMPHGAMNLRSSLISSPRPPSAQAEDIPVNATADADIVLKPR